MFLYQQHQRYFAQVGGGLEELAAAELHRLGARDVRPLFRGLSFGADQASLYRICHQSRLAGRILAPLAHHRCHSDRYLYKMVNELAWETLFSPETTFKVTAHLVNSRLRHSQYAVHRIKDGIADRFTARCGRRPPVDRRQPQAMVHLHLDRDRATLYLDLGGGSLHRRGYRQESTPAPLSETVAAAVVQASGWAPHRPLLDPMCGSGTLVLEAHMQACNIASGSLRKTFGVFLLPEFDDDLWQRVTGEARRAVTPAGTLCGNDRDPRAVRAARANAARLPHHQRITWRVGDYQELTVAPGTVILCNPPHDRRLQPAGGIENFLRRFGDFLKQRCRGCEAYLYLGDPVLLKYVGLRPAWKKPLASGGLDGRLARYDIY